MKRLVLNRLQKLDDRTLGRLCVFSGLELEAIFATLELPWRNNEKGNSCILSAFYTVEPRRSQKFGEHLVVLNTAPRADILFHHGNFPKDTTGCVLVGSDFSDIDQDKKLEITNSKRAMQKLVKLVTERAELIIL